MTGADGQFIVSGSHSYANPGSYTVTVTVTDAQDRTASATSTAQVGDVLAGSSATLTVASFTSSDPSATAGEFTATVNWGDGTPLDHTTTVTQVGGGFTVQGTHTYAADSLDEAGGAYDVTVTINGPEGETITQSKQMTVERPEVTGVNENLVAQPGVALTGDELATFTDPDVSDLPGEFTATVFWGDGTMSSGSVIGSEARSMSSAVTPIKWRANSRSR